MDDSVKFCFRCGTKMRQGELFCPQCGTRVPDSLLSEGTSDRGFTLKCSVCGHEEMEGDARYCLKCGSEYGLVCGSCGRLNPFDSVSCERCGSPFTRGSIAPKASEVFAQMRLESEATKEGRELARISALSAKLDRLRKLKLALLVIGAAALALAFYALTHPLRARLLAAFSVQLIVFGAGNILNSLVILLLGNRPERYYAVSITDCVFAFHIALAILLITLIENVILGWIKGFLAIYYYAAWIIIGLCAAVMIFEIVRMIRAIVCQVRANKALAAER